MKVIAVLAPRSADSLLTELRLAEEKGFHGVGLVDSPGFLETYLSLGVAAAATSRLSLGPFVTNVVTRSPFVTARATASLAELTGGRAFVGLGAGDSAAHRAGVRPATVGELARGIESIRATWASTTGTNLPVIVTGSGPRTLELAGRLADVVVVGAGLDDPTLARCFTAVNAGMVESGRTRDDIEVWVYARCYVGTEAAARRALAPLLAAGANYSLQTEDSMRSVPPRLHGAVRRLRSSYDYVHHGRALSDVGADTFADPDFVDYLMQRWAVVGPADAVVDRLEALGRTGVDGVVVPAIGEDPYALLSALGDEVLPRL